MYNADSDGLGLDSRPTIACVEIGGSDVVRVRAYFYTSAGMDAANLQTIRNIYTLIEHKKNALVVLADSNMDPKELAFDGRLGKFGFEIMLHSSTDVTCHLSEEGSLL